MREEGAALRQCSWAGTPVLQMDWCLPPMAASCLPADGLCLSTVRLPALLTPKFLLKERAQHCSQTAPAASRRKETTPCSTTLLLQAVVQSAALATVLRVHRTRVFATRPSAPQVVGGRSAVSHVRCPAQGLVGVVAGTVGAAAVESHRTRQSAQPLAGRAVLAVAAHPTSIQRTCRICRGLRRGQHPPTFPPVGMAR